MLCMGRLRSTLTCREDDAGDGTPGGVLAAESTGGLDLTRFFVTGFGTWSSDFASAVSSMSHRERFLEGVEGPAWGSSLSIVVE